MTLPKSAALGVGVKHAQIDIGAAFRPCARQNLGQQRRTHALTARPIGKHHLAQIGIARRWKAKGQLGHAGKLRALKQAQTLALCGVAIGRRIGHKFCRQGFGIKIQPIERPIIAGGLIHLHQRCAICGRIKRPDHRTITSSGS